MIFILASKFWINGIVVQFYQADTQLHHPTASLTCYLTFASITRRSGVDFEWRTWDRITSIFDLGIIFAYIFRCVVYCYCGIFVISYIWSQISTIRSLQGVSTCIHVRTTKLSLQLNFFIQPSIVQRSFSNNVVHARVRTQPIRR